jgi:hypothetical protein
MDLLGEHFASVIHRDRWKPYEVFKRAIQQLCHSHIRRDFQSMLTVAGTARKRGIDLLDWLSQAIQAKNEGQPTPAFRS